jgi:hypothetical protein
MFKRSNFDHFFARVVNLITFDVVYDQKHIFKKCRNILKQMQNYSKKAKIT